MKNSYPCKILGRLLVLAISLGLPACKTFGGGTSYSSLSETMAGPWDFTVTNAKGRVPFVIEAILDQDHHGNISATGSVTTSGPAGNVATVFISGGSLAAANAVFLGYPGFTCNGSDSGDRSVTGSINSSNQVTLNWNVGGSAIMTITGTMNHAAHPPFTGTFTTTGTCGGSSGTIVGNWPINIIPGPYAGTSTVDSTEAISLTLSGLHGPITGTGTDSKLGSFTLSGNAEGNFISATITYASSPSNSGPVFAYYNSPDTPTGSLFLVSYIGQSITTCPNSELNYSGTCQIAILSLP
ncbi:MAG TPA: hypothetical protein VE866_04070 [Candidatus Binatia bacterium]|nr:hypothetical protein [Candidatus Binatia bacterium]